MIDIACRAGVRTKEVKAGHGFRKFFTTQLINSEVNPEIREMLSLNVFIIRKIKCPSCR
jgi:hypothetical protein